MSTFDRGLDCEFIDALNREYRKDGWWRSLVDDPELFIAIRKNYLNVYYRGCSLVKLDWKSGEIIGEVHYKYLLRPFTPKEYVNIRNGNITLDSRESLFVGSLRDIEDIKKAAAPYAGQEKIGVHNILAANPNVIDVEIAFGSSEDNPLASRIDFAALQPLDDNNGVKLVFFEAKHFDNREALRASDELKPNVVKQIERYSSLIIERWDDIIRSYCQVCSNLTNLQGMTERYPKSLLKRVIDAPTKMAIDEIPVLIVFGFDSDQRDGKNWGYHRDKLKAHLGKNKVQFKGDADKFVRGISV